MITKEQIKEWLDNQIEANKIMNSTLLNGAIRRTYQEDRIQVFRGVKLICDILDLPWIERDWDGNGRVGSNYRERLFVYDDFVFFELAPAEEFAEEDKKNDEKAEITD